MGIIVNRKAIISNESVDRDGAVIVQKGINLDAFLKNPILLYNHDSSVIIGKVLEIEKTANGLEISSIEFFDFGQGHEKSFVVEQYREGILNAFSVGILLSKKDVRKTEKAMFIDKCELYELSLVTIPSNRDAVVKLFERTENGEVKLCNFNFDNMPTENEKDFEALQKSFAELKTEKEALQKGFDAEKEALQKALDTESTLRKGLQELLLENSNVTSEFVKKYFLQETDFEAIKKGLAEIQANDPKQVPLTVQKTATENIADIAYSHGYPNHLFKK
jgi:HK97 family phage prohead protease